MLNTTCTIILSLFLCLSNAFAHEDDENKLEQMPLNYAPLQVIEETYRKNTDRIAHFRPDSRESFTDLYLKDTYVYLGNSYDGIRIIDVSNPSTPQEVGRFPKSAINISYLSNSTIQNVVSDNPFLLPTDVIQTNDGTFLIADYGYTRITGFKQTLSSVEKTGTIYKIDPQTHAITALTQGTPLTHPFDLALAPNGKLIVANASNGGSGIFSVDLQTGDVTPLLQDSKITFPYGVAVSPTGTIFFTQIGDYRTNQTSTLYKLDANTGAFNAIVSGNLTTAEPFALLTDIALDPNGNIIAIDPGIYPLNAKPKILKINPETGATQVLSSNGQLHSPTKLAIHQNGDIYISDRHADPHTLGITTGTIFKLDPQFNTLTVHATGPNISAPFGLTISNTGNPTWTNINKRTRISDIKIKDNIAIATNEGFNLPFIFDEGLLGIQILDISDPTHPIEISKYTQDVSDFGVHNTYIYDHHAYLINNSGDLQILDISNPKNPTKVSDWAIPETEQTLPKRIIPHDLSVVNNRAYVAYAEAGLRILDVSNPKNPVKISTHTYNNGWTHSAVPSDDGTLVFITDEQPGGIMRIIDINSLNTPKQIGTYQSSNRIVSRGNPLSIHNIQVKGNLIYVGNYQDGFRVVDVSNPTQPTEVGAYLLSGTYLDRLYNGAWSAFPSNGLVYLSDLEHGLFILQYQNPISPVADFDHDGQIDFADLILFAQQFGKKNSDPTFDTQFDLNTDNEIGFADFLIFAKTFATP
ncbi:MAG: choice-of-anchor B domain-containing protein [Candidatus Latescibacterota bacterium]|jgi:choice-of-anchor B domain-containing protein